MAVVFLHTNDLHGTLDDALEVALRRLREGADLYFDTGDVIKTGNLGVPLRKEQAWARLERLGCTASVIGNRETHVLESAFHAKLAGAAHPALCANLRRRDGGPSPLRGEIVVEAKGLRVGVFGVSVAMVTERMATKAASAYLWDPPIATARTCVDRLRPQVDLLVALTHIGHRQDRELAEKVEGIDVIFGGHSHTVLEMPEYVGRTAIVQGGSHGRFAGVYRWEEDRLTGGLVPLDG